MSASLAAPTTVRELVPLCYVDDIRRSVAFYEQLLDFRRTQSWEPEGELAWCRLDRDGAAIMLQQTCAEDRFATPRGDGITFYFLCDDAEDVYCRLRDRGCPVDPPKATFYGMRQVLIADPDGYRLCFQNPIPDEGRPSAAGD